MLEAWKVHPSHHRKCSLRSQMWDPPKDQGWMREEDFSLKSVRVKCPEAGKHREIFQGYQTPDIKCIANYVLYNHGPFCL